MSILANMFKGLADSKDVDDDSASTSSSKSSKKSLKSKDIFDDLEDDDSVSSVSVSEEEDDADEETDVLDKLKENALTEIRDTEGGEKHVEFIKWFAKNKELIENYVDIVSHKNGRMRSGMMCNSRRIPPQIMREQMCDYDEFDFSDEFSEKEKSKAFKLLDDEVQNNINEGEKDFIIKCDVSSIRINEGRRMRRPHEFENHSRTRAMIDLIDKYCLEYMIETNENPDGLHFTKYTEGGLNSKAIKDEINNYKKELEVEEKEFIEKCCAMYDKYLVSATRKMINLSNNRITLNISRRIDERLVLPVFIKNYPKVLDRMTISIDKKPDDFGGGMGVGLCIPKEEGLQYLNENIRMKILEYMSQYEKDGFKFQFADIYMQHAHGVQAIPSVDKFFLLYAYVTDIEEKTENEAVPAEGEQDKCPICMMSKKNMVINCGHLYCPDCVKIMQKCPVCKIQITRIQKVYL